MPLTSKGQEIKSAMEREYGKEKGTSVFYASRNKGTITGVDAARDAAGCPQHGYMDACRRSDAAGMASHSHAMLRGRMVR